MKKKILRIIMIISSLFIFLVPIGYGLIVNAINNANNEFVISDSTLDLKNNDIDKIGKIQLNGTMEFYYNQWLISDNEEETEKTADIELPSFWTSVRYNGSKLTKYGYATYRFNVTNVPIGNVFSADTDFYYSSFRIYFDDILIGQCGTLGKTTAEDKVGSRFTQYSYFTATKSEFVVTIEVGNSAQAGLVKAPRIQSATITQNSDRSKDLILFSMMGILFGCLILMVIGVSINNKKKQAIYTTLTAVSLFFYWLFSGEGLRVMNLVNISFISYTVYKTLSLIFMGLFIFFFYQQFIPKTNSINKHKRYNFLFFSVDFIAAICMCIARQTKLILLPFSLLIIMAILFSTNLNINEYNRPNPYRYIFDFILGGFTLMIMEDSCFFSYYMPYSISVILLISSFALFVCFFINVFKKRQSEEELTEELEKQSELTTLATREQINPDSIFNTLTIIENIYHQDNELGNKALLLFSDSLRYNINTIEEITVPFEKEIDDIMRLVEYENIRRLDEIEVLFNIEYHDFLLPPVSLRPILEEMIRKKDISDNGYIEIHSEKNEDEVIVTMTDTRSNYEISEKVISTAQKRLQMTLDGELYFSYDNSYTCFTIIIPTDRRQRRRIYK